MVAITAPKQAIRVLAAPTSVTKSPSSALTLAQGMAAANATQSSDTPAKKASAPAIAKTKKPTAPNNVLSKQIVSNTFSAKEITTPTSANALTHAALKAQKKPSASIQN